MRSKLANMSPEEVISGGMYGMPNQFGTESEDYKPQKEEILKELS